jgi:hypothetical protein
MACELDKSYSRTRILCVQRWSLEVVVFCARLPKETRFVDPRHRTTGMAAHHRDGEVLKLRHVGLIL